MLVASANYIGAAFEGSKKQIIPPEESDLVRKNRAPQLASRRPSFSN